TRLEASREAAYEAAADERVNTANLTVDEVVDEVIALFTPYAQVRVELGERSYSVLITQDYFGLWVLGEDYARVAFVTDANVEAACGDRVREFFGDVQHETFVIEAEELAHSITAR